MNGFAFAIPGDIDAPTGGYRYDRRVIAECRRSGCEVTHVALPDRFPFPTLDDLVESEARLKAIPAGLPILIDGLAMAVLPERLLRDLHRPVVALVHHPLALETGLDAGQQAMLKASERTALSFAAIVIATSPSTAALLERDYGVSRERLVIALPGNDPLPRARGTGAPPRLLSVGTILPRKAHGVLVEALASLSSRAWMCHIVGATDRDIEETRSLRHRIETHKLGDRIVLTGAMSQEALAAEFAAADLFVSASLFEGYGMALTEAIAHGLPVVATRGGAIPDTVPAAASILVPPNDAASLAEAIGALISDPARRTNMARNAWDHAAALPNWPQTSAIIMKALRETPS